LARAQADRVVSLFGARLPELEIELLVVETQGDRDQERPLRELGRVGIFAKEIQLALLEGRADVAVHSAKDLPSTTPEGLELVAVPERLDPADVLVGRSLSGLGPGATVATGSPRREALLRSLRPDLNIVELRGNMARRLGQVGSGGIDAVMTAQAALERLGMVELVAERLDPLVFTPQVGQGALALECRSGDPLSGLVAQLDDGLTHGCLEAERSFLASLGAGCSTPAGAWCVAAQGSFTLRAVMAGPQSGRLSRFEQAGQDPSALGAAAAQALGPAAQSS
jgi:hydroxymethylbilane synthase